MDVYTYVRTYVCMYVCMYDLARYVCMYVCMQVCMYSMYIHAVCTVHTHIHACTGVSIIAVSRSVHSRIIG